MTQPPPDPMTGLAGLARELDALRRKVDALAPLPAQVKDLVGIIAGLAGGGPGRPRPEQGLPSWLDLSGDFAEAVTVLGDLAGWLQTVYLRYPDAASGLPECWLWHPDVVEELLWLRGAWLEAYAAESAAVARAGDWHDRQRPGVTRRIRAAASGLPECWLWHPVVEELLWLRGAWLEAYAAESAAVARAGDWHDRQRPGVTRRIRAAAGTCSLEAHQPGGDRHRAAHPVPLAEAIHLIGEWWSTDRRACAPAPDAGHVSAAAALRTPRGRR